MPQQFGHLGVRYAFRQGIGGEGMTVAVGNARLHPRLLAKPGKSPADGLRREPPVLSREEKPCCTVKPPDDFNGFGCEEQDSALAQVGRLVLGQQSHSLHQVHILRPQASRSPGRAPVSQSSCRKARNRGEATAQRRAWSSADTRAFAPRLAFGGFRR